MFARTPRLTLRPGWPEDAPAVARAAAHHEVAKMLTHLPWPYEEAHAAAWLASPRSAIDATCMILSHEAPYPEVIGVISITEREGAHNLGYWLTPHAWGRGYATEAGKAMLGMARHALGLKQLRSSHFLDNPASGKVLTKLGFRRTGERLMNSCARDYAAPSAVLDLDLVTAAPTADFNMAAWAA